MLRQIIHSLSTLIQRADDLGESDDSDCGSVSTVSSSGTTATGSRFSRSSRDPKKPPRPPPPSSTGSTSLNPLTPAANGKKHAKGVKQFFGDLSGFAAERVNKKEFCSDYCG